MASIPDIPDTSPSFSTIGNPIIPTSDRRTSGYDAGIVGGAIADTGKQITGIANDLMQKQNEISKAQALSNTFSDVIKAQKQAELEPDPQKAQDIYTNARNQSIQQNAATIPGPLARQEFSATVGMHMQWMDKAFGQNLVDKQKQAGLASIDQSTQDSVDNYSQLNDPEARAAVLQQHQSYLTTMKNTGVITPEQFQQKSKDFAKQASLAYYEMHPDELAPDLMKRLGTNTIPTPGIAPTAQDVSTAILGHESANGKNTATSAKGAVGVGQIIPTTFQMYAKPGESIVNESDNLAVHQRIINDYMQRYNGDASRVAVAYISGPGNVAPAGSPTPWVKDLNDGNENVSDYVANVNKRLGVSPQLVAQNDNKTGKPIDNIPPYQALQVAQAAEARGSIVNKIQAEQLKKKQEGVMNDYLTKGLKGEPTSDIADDKVLTFEQREKVLTALNNHAKSENKTDPAIYNDLTRRINLPDGDPNKMTDPQELLGYLGKGINPENLKSLQTAMSDPPELKSFIKMGHDQLSSSSAMSIDGEGERRAYNWEMATRNAIAQAQKPISEGGKGLSVHQLINPSSKDYIGNNIGNYREDLTTQANNLAAKLRANTPSEPLPADKVRQPGETADAFVKRLGL